MSDSARTSPGDELSRDAAAVIDDYFAQLASPEVGAGAAIGADELAELRSHVLDRLSATPGTAADATGVLAELGSPETLAHAFAEAAAEHDAEPGAGPRRASALTGRVLGIPYDVRRPSTDRYASRTWNPTDSRILVPKALGMGWTINFGALAVKARLIRQDDEDAPFEAVPDRVVTATLAAPIAAVAAFGVTLAATWSSLPASVPVHWGISGQVDGYGSRGSAIGSLTLLAAVPVLVAVGVHARRRRAFNRVAASAVSLAFAALALALLAGTSYSAGGSSGAWPIWIGIGGSVALPLLLLAGVSRLGRAAEQRRDISSPTSKGRAR